MVYAYDQWAQMPVKDLYDTQMMLAHVAAAKDMYEKAAKELEDFRKEYGQFYSPIASQQAWYDKNFNVSGKIKEIYDRGGDPLRNAVDRAELYQYINSRPYTQYAEMKKNAENAELYEKAAGELAAKGLYDPYFDAWRLYQARHNGDMSNFDPSQSPADIIANWGDKPFNLTSPIQYSTLRDMVHPTFDAIEEHLLTPEEVKSRNYDYDERNDYYGIVRADMERAMGEYMPGVRNDPRFQYHRYLAAQDLVREGNENPTEEQIDERLINNAITADAGVMTPLKIKANEWKMAEYDRQTRYTSARISHGGGGGPDRTPSLFVESFLSGGKPITYSTKDNPLYQWINVPDGVEAVQNNSTGKWNYFVPKKAFEHLYLASNRIQYDSEGNPNRSSRISLADVMNGSRTGLNELKDAFGYGSFGSMINAPSLFNMYKDTYFNQVGQMHTEYDPEDGKPHFYITGTLTRKGKDEDGNVTDVDITDANGNLIYVDMEVTEQYYSYGKKQSGEYNPTNRGDVLE